MMSIRCYVLYDIMQLYVLTYFSNVSITYVFWNIVKN